MKKAILLVALSVMSVLAFAQNYRYVEEDSGYGSYEQRQYQAAPQYREPRYDDRQQQYGRSQQYGQQQYQYRNPNEFEVDILEAREVMLKGNGSTGTTMAYGGGGAALGGLIGSRVGKGNGKKVATVAGALIGAGAGAAMAPSEQIRGQELAIRHVGSSTVNVIVQPGTGLRAGDRGIATFQNGEVRVQRARY